MTGRQRLELPFESIKSMPFGVNEVTLWHDVLLDCDRVGKRIDLLGIDSSIAPEAATMQQIRHLNVVEVVGAARVDGYPAPMNVIEIITPYYPLGSVTDALLRGDVFTASEAISIVRSALLGLEELHEVHSLCHRDIKGGNILLRSRSVGVVADLGLAGRMDANGMVIALENPTLYSPPELITAGSVGRDGDIFSTALVLRELLGGAFPYADYSRSDVVDSLTRGRLPIRAHDLELPIWSPSSLRRIVRKALSKRPAGRYQSARPFHAALGSIRVLDWVQLDALTWIARTSDREVQVDLEPKGRAHDLSIRVDQGRGMRRVQPAERVTGLGDPALLRAFDMANSL